jgi:hypothetical protein
MMAGGAVAGLVIGLTVAVLIVRASMANEKARGRTGGFWSWVGRRWGQGACFTLGTLMLVSAAMAGEYGVSSTLIAGVVFLVLAVILRIVSKLRPIQPAATSDRAPLVG